MALFAVLWLAGMLTMCIRHAACALPRHKRREPLLPYQMIPSGLIFREPEFLPSSARHAA